MKCLSTCKCTCHIAWEFRKKIQFLSEHT